MGAWGAKLYQDDVAQDVRDQYKELIRKGNSNEEATEQLLQDYNYTLSDIDDGPIFWFALADTQWGMGRLLPEVKEQALIWIDNGSDQKRWEKENPKKAKERKQVLEDLRSKLSAPIPPIKKIPQTKNYKCEWKVGDVYAYKLDSDYAREKGIYGRSFLFQKIDETIWYPEHIIPIVWIRITEGEMLPTNEKEFFELKYVQTSTTKYEDRFMPYDGSRYEEDIFEKSKIKYEVDDNGKLAGYRFMLINTSKRIIPKKLVYVGNFKTNQPPDKEFVPHSKHNINCFIWKFFDELMIDVYCIYNMK
jgi:hypothetical protein